MDIERLSGNGSSGAPRKITIYFVSACIHAVLILCVGFFLFKPAEMTDILKVKLSTLQLPAHSPGPSSRQAPSPAGSRREKKTRATAPEPVSHAVLQDSRRNGPAAPSLSIPALPGNDLVGTIQGSTQGGQETGKGDGASGGGSSQGGGLDLKAYYAAVNARIESAKRYPEAARRRQLEGRVVVSFRLARDGNLTAAQVSRSSGIAILDQAALSAVRNGAPYPRYPGEETEKALDIPLTFRCCK